MPFRLLVSVFSSLLFAASAAAQSSATGFVFEDKNNNGNRDADEPGISDVGVSNGREVASTDAEGRWTLPYDDDTIFFVIKPSGWTPPVNADQLPQFYYIHKPAGSPKEFRYAGVAPTGPLPGSIDFPLRKSEEPDTFKAIFFGDPQPSTIEQVDYVAHDVIGELIGTDAKFGVTLGDIMFDRLELFDPSNANIAKLGIPWYNVIGNHDVNREATSDGDSDETFHRYFGPVYYSFDHGPVHFIVLDDIDWGDHERNGHVSYRGELGEEQLAFVKNDLARVPEDKLVMLMMHIPLGDVEDVARGELFRLIENRPHTLSISGHTHWHAHQYLGKEKDWQGEEPHHHIVNVTVCGTWWKGQKDEQGIPHATMRDGAPNGYSVITFDGTTHTLDFKAARQPADYQMSIFAPDEVKVATADQTQIYVNVFNGSEKSVVKMRVGADEQEITLAKVAEKDPYYVSVRQREMQAAPDAVPLNEPVDSAHLWKAKLPAGLTPGSHLIRVEATDAYAREWRAARMIRVVP